MGETRARLERTIRPVSEIYDADADIAAIREAASLLRDDPNRKGSVISFGLAGQLVVTGDMHGNLRNFEKLERFCQLQRNPARYVILHELIHSEVDVPGKLDLSIDLLVRACRWKIEYPDNVFFLQSNHEMAQLRRQEITKGGRSVLHDFEAGIAHRYGRRTTEVLAAVDEYIAALPLAARTANGFLVCHSLPDPLLMESFDTSVFDRIPNAIDMTPGGSAYALVWGRFQSPQAVDYFAARLGVEFFVVGHTPQEFGYTIVGGRMIILASDHNHGAFLPIDLNKKHTIDELQWSIRKFVGVE